VIFLRFRQHGHQPTVDALQASLELNWLKASVRSATHGQ
jgi:hypothetical protein